MNLCDWAKLIANIGAGVLVLCVAVLTVYFNVICYQERLRDGLLATAGTLFLLIIMAAAAIADSKLCP